MSQSPKLIVVQAFDFDDVGTPQASVEPLQFDSEDRARRHAVEIAGKHAGVIAWSREANPDLGEYGEPTIIYMSGEVGELD
tara:strand:+ start:1811 stop:2053 length:243 start_codon:yes stop_codon:yes gene_type:complete